MSSPCAKTLAGLLTIKMSAANFKAWTGQQPTTGHLAMLFNNAAPKNAVAVMSRDSRTRVSNAGLVER